MNVNNPLNTNKPYGHKIDSIYKEAYDRFEGNEADAQEYAHEKTCEWIVENPITTWVSAEDNLAKYLLFSNDDIIHESEVDDYYRENHERRYISFEEVEIPDIDYKDEDAINDAIWAVIDARLVKPESAKKALRFIGSDMWAHGLPASDAKRFYTLTKKQYKQIKKGWKKMDKSYSDSCIKAHDSKAHASEIAELERDLDWRDGQ